MLKNADPRLCVCSAELAAQAELRLGGRTALPVVDDAPYLEPQHSSTAGRENAFDEQVTLFHSICTTQRASVCRTLHCHVCAISAAAACAFARGMLQVGRIKGSC